MVSIISFREQLKRIRWSRPVRPVWEDRYKIHKPDRSKLSAFFLSTKHTPGCHSPRKWKRSLARIWHEFKLTLLSEHVNLMLVFLPLSVTSDIVTWDPILTFVLNYCAIVPLVSLISYATQERSFGRLPHAIFCNAAELIIALVSVIEGGSNEFISSFILGSLVNNLLLINGTCFFLGGIVNMWDARGDGTQRVYGSGTLSTGLSVIGIFTAVCVVLTALNYFLLPRGGNTIDSLAMASHRASIILLCLYLLYLYFSLRTHPNLFRRPVLWDDDNSAEEERGKKEGPVERRAALVILSSSILMLTFCAVHLIRNLPAVIETRNVTPRSLGFIFVPFACSGAKNAIAVDLAMKNDMDQALTMAMEPSLQLALLITPTMIILGWIAGRFTIYLEFDILDAVVLIFSLLTFAHCLRDGKSDYFKGAWLLALYIIRFSNGIAGRRRGVAHHLDARNRSRAITLDTQGTNTTSVAVISNAAII